MTEKKKTKVAEEEKSEIDTEIEEEEHGNRDWKKVLIGILFVLIVVVFWYVIEYAAR
ncbi:MAG: hypothetical protein GPJ51_12540 [Candidatus Heimdallarchaeota archaeon]|nr:hypothetical protein [Candidatus Heimdallarchaeota archaeon]